MRIPALIVLIALTAPAAAESRRVVGYAGVLGEWELIADVTETATGEFSGSATMTHTAICTQDGPEQKTGDIRLRISSSQLNATLSLAGLECRYSARLSDAYRGQISCPDQPLMPLTLWVR